MEGEPAAMTAWPLVERGASSRKRQVIGASDMESGTAASPRVMIKQALDSSRCKLLAYS